MTNKRRGKEERREWMENGGNPRFPGARFVVGNGGGREEEFSRKKVDREKRGLREIGGGGGCDAGARGTP